MACVASNLGQTFGVQKIGAMVFGNSLDQVAIGAWGIDDAAVRKASQILTKQFAVRRIYLSKTKQTGNETRTGSWSFFRNSSGDPARVLRAAAGTGKCDVYLVLTRSSSSYGGTNQVLTGLGIVDHSVLMERVYLFASYAIQIYDGKTFEVLKSDIPANEHSLVQGFTGPGINAMYRRVDKSWWPATPQAAAQSAQLRNATRELVEKGIAKMLPFMLQGA